MQIIGSDYCAEWSGHKLRIKGLEKNYGSQPPYQRDVTAFRASRIFAAFLSLFGGQTIWIKPTADSPLLQRVVIFARDEHFATAYNHSALMAQLIARGVCIYWMRYGVPQYFFVLDEKRNFVIQEVSSRVVTSWLISIDKKAQGSIQIYRDSTDQIYRDSTDDLIREIQKVFVKKDMMIQPRCYYDPP